MDVTLVAALVAVVLVLAVVLKSVHRIGPAEVGLVIKNLGFKKLHDDDPSAFGGEAGYRPSCSCRASGSGSGRCSR